MGSSEFAPTPMGGAAGQEGGPDGLVDNVSIATGHPAPDADLTVRQKVMNTTQSWSVSVGRLELDLSGYRARFGDRVLALNASQIEVLAILLVNRSRVCSRQELCEALNLYGARSIDEILSRLRRQVGEDFIKNVPNLGWIIDPEKLA